MIFLLVLLVINRLCEDDAGWGRGGDKGLWLWGKEGMKKKEDTDLIFKNVMSACLRKVRFS